MIMNLMTVSEATQSLILIVVLFFRPSSCLSRLMVLTVIQVSPPFGETWTMAVPAESSSSSSRPWLKTSLALVAPVRSTAR
ncbi:MAG: hypothetical protein DRJ28_00720 [Actinobacteria bacterium]|nr:MAG: hypothetical protein DRJ28_00720 [Actinomycetota bacterium]